MPKATPTTVRPIKTRKISPEKWVTKRKFFGTYWTVNRYAGYWGVSPQNENTRTATIPVSPGFKTKKRALAWLREQYQNHPTTQGATAFQAVVYSNNSPLVVLQILRKGTPQIKSTSTTPEEIILF